MNASSLLIVELTTGYMIVSRYDFSPSMSVRREVKRQWQSTHNLSVVVSSTESEPYLPPCCRSFKDRHMLRRRRTLEKALLVQMMAFLLVLVFRFGCPCGSSLDVAFATFLVCNLCSWISF
eukprot:scaffold1949_cov348-Pavlova_lutheri.AAC.1